MLLPPCLKDDISGKPLLFFLSQIKGPNKEDDMSLNVIEYLDGGQKVYA